MRQCPSCGEENPERAAFCVACGAPLPRQVVHGEERKTVTILFCDLAGFTARSDRADPEDVKARLTPFHARLKRELEGFGATLEKFIGDAAVGVFGAPVSHEDDPERAVRTAFKIHDAIRELNERQPGLELAARIGIATGEAMVSLSPGPQVGDTVTGDVVNLASVIQTATPVGGTAVSETTYRATRDSFEWEQLASVRVATLPEPLPVWRPVAPRSILVHQRPHGPFVGREEELGMLRAAFRRAVTEESVQLVTIVGEPGVGKTRLIAELADYLDTLPDLIRWREGRCPPYGEGVGLLPLSQMVRSEAGILGSDPVDEVLGKLVRSVEAVVEDPSDREWLTARLEPLVGIGSTASTIDRAESYTAWRRFFEALADEHPTILVFEDLQWAEPLLLGFVDHLVDWAIASPLLVVCAARPELFERHRGWGGGKRNATSVSLPPLSDAETGMLVSGLLEGSMLREDLQAALLERAGGNPLFAEEFARMLADRRDLAASGLGDAEPMPVPDSIQAVIGARLDTLPLGAKAVLHDAAVVGRVFWSGTLAAMSGLSDLDVEAQLIEMAKRELIRRVRPSSIEDEHEYAFWHVLVRDVAYVQIPRADRAAKHRAAADWLEAAAGESVAEQAERLAFHYAAATELTRMLGQDTTELEARTARFLMTAGNRLRSLDVASAEAHYRRALSLMPPDDPERPRALVRAAELAAVAGRFSEAENEFDEAVQAFRETGDRLGLGEALAMEARAIHRRGRVARSEELMREALELLESEPPGPELVRAYTRAAGHALTLARFEECLGYAQRGLALARERGMRGEAVRALQFRGAARYQLGDVAGIEDLREAVRVGLERGLGEETEVAYGNLAYDTWLQEGPRAALGVWEEALSFAEARGFETAAMWDRGGMLEVLHDLGRWDEVLEIARRMEEWSERMGGGSIGPFARSFRALVQARRGHPEAEELAEGARAVSEATAESSGPEFGSLALVAAAVLQHRLGNTPEARALIERFAALTADDPGFRLLYLPEALRIPVAEGDPAAAALMPAGVEPHGTRARLALATAEAILTEARGDRARAASLYGECAAAWERYGSVLERAFALRGEGRCLLERDPALGTERLREAAELFASLGAEPLRSEIEVLLREAEPD